MSLDIHLKDPTATYETEYLFDANITHNLGEMADKAGIYDCLWRPDENGITRAKQLIKPLRKGIAMMKKKPDYFRQFNASNGWGTYDVFVPWLEKLLKNCEQYPKAKIRVSV